MRCTLWMGCASLLAVTVAGAAAGEAETVFKRSLSTGLTLNRGNTEALQTYLSLVSEGERKGFGALRTGIEGQYGESRVDGRKETTTENARAFANARRSLTRRTFGALDGTAAYDRIAELDYRLTLGPAYGVFLIMEERTTLTAEIGPAYVWEEVAGERDDYLAARFGERFTHELTETARIWQTLDILPKADDFSDVLLNAELGLEAAVSHRMNMRVTAQHRYDRSPGEGLKRSDLVLMVGIGVTL